MPEEIPPPDDPNDWMARAVGLIPWLQHLPQDAREEFFTDLIRSVQQSTELGINTGVAMERLVTEMAAWKATAEVHADPELLEALTRPLEIEDFVPVHRPGEDCPDPVRDAGKPRIVPKRRCGASLPHEDADDGWYWCVLPSGHTGVHHEGDPATGWEDGETVEVYTTDEVRSVPDHIHDFVGDEDTCVADSGCTLPWGGFNHWQGFRADYEIRDEIADIPQQRSGEDG